MSWTAPRTWVSSEFVSVDIMNTHVRDNLIAIDGYLDTSCIAGSTILPLICDSLGGTDSHRPVVDGTTYTAWHLCNGDADIDSLGYTAPDLRNYFPAGAGGAYAQWATGGALTTNNAHTHAEGTMATAADAGLVNHTHVYQANTAGPNTTTTTDTAGPQFAATSTHTHYIDTTSGNPTTNPTHTHTTLGESASAGSATQDILPAYRAQYFFLYLGA